MMRVWPDYLHAHGIKEYSVYIQNFQQVLTTV